MGWRSSSAGSPLGKEGVTWWKRSRVGEEGVHGGNEPNAKNCCKGLSRGDESCRRKLLRPAGKKEPSEAGTPEETEAQSADV